jgi:hypothetical protein
VERQQDQVDAGDEEQEQAHHQIQRRASEVRCLQQYGMCDGCKKNGIARVADPYSFDTDPDPDPHFRLNTAPDPDIIRNRIQTGSNPDPVMVVKKWDIQGCGTAFI